MATEQEIQLAEDTRDRTRSVTREDMASGQIRWVFPTFGFGDQRLTAVLPENLPAYNRYTYFRRRDITLLSTPLYEGMWADAVNIAVTKIAGWDWEIESAVPLRRKRLQNILLQSTAGIFNGWVPFLSAHLRSFILTGYSVVEIERETSAYTSRIKALHHLNPLRCQITDDPKVPILYYDRQSRVHELKYYDVMVFGDQVNSTLGDYAMVEGAAERAYQRITLLSAISQYLYEKVTGKRPLELNFVQGITQTHLKDNIASTAAERNAQGSQLYMGVAVQAIPGDVPIQKVTIPLAGLPENFDSQQLRDDAYIIYANSLGLDVNDIDPRLATRAQLGSGAQALILDQKSKGRGLISWKKQWLHAVNFWVADTQTKFAFSEQTPDDELKTEQIKKQRIDNINAMIDKGIITADQGRNLLVDNGDLPREFLDVDVTGGDILEDDDKMTEGNEPAPQPEPTAVPATDEEARETAVAQQEAQRSREQQKEAHLTLDQQVNAAILQAQTAVNSALALKAIEEDVYATDAGNGREVIGLAEAESVPENVVIATAEALLESL